MALLINSLRQAFMPKHEYDNLREEDKALTQLQRPVLISLFLCILLVIVVSTSISVKIVFPGDGGKRPFCRDFRIQPLSINVSGGSGSGDLDVFPGAFYLTDQQTVDYYWMVVFVPSCLVFFVSLAYLVAGMAVAYTAPTRHGCLKVVENNYCASKRGGVRCLSILNAVFAIVFGLLALFLGSTLLTLGSSCAVPLFWCYETASWALVILYGVTSYLLRRKAAAVLDESDYAGRNMGLEMLEANPVEVTPEVERRLNEGFKAWMGTSYLSSDDEDDPNDYLEVQHPPRTNSSRQRV
ncbi:Histone-lysine N-methyltransferase, H3 lysine-79 specific like [Heracleum sosnowskyi]|uniref:Histone-lysine N-methyltransferase, H3 lysine-79 specific like n=1 Tax=Heracleum sosnowskyi TaxID=360622 RepID=A0AAD8MGK4_9APIA|nr:Histone-lysine N-methyltransferase, H3 lysine-79 specific like [Heracleum sosnowskyi]